MAAMPKYGLVVLIRINSDCGTAFEEQYLLNGPDRNPLRPNRMNTRLNLMNLLLVIGFRDEITSKAKALFLVASGMDV